MAVSLWALVCKRLVRATPKPASIITYNGGMEPLTRLLFVMALGALAVLTYQLDRANDQAAHFEAKAAQEKAHALQAAYALEQQHLKKIEEIEHDTKNQLAQVQRSAASANRAADGLRQQLTTFAQRNQASDAGTACQCEATGQRLELLAHLFSDLDGMAGAYAQTADDARIRGLACERAYGAVKTDGMDEKQ